MPDYRPRRMATRFPVTLRTENGPVEVTMRDISIDGVKVDADTPIMAGSAVSLTIGHMSLPALVQWSRKGSLGLRFMERPDPNMLKLIPEDDR